MFYETKHKQNKNKEILQKKYRLCNKTKQRAVLEDLLKRHNATKNAKGRKAALRLF